MRFSGTKIKLIISRLYLDRNNFLKVVRQRLKRTKVEPTQNFKKSSLLVHGFFHQGENIVLKPGNLAQGLLIINFVIFFEEEKKINS